MIELIINGDDFGSSKSVNEAIIQSFKKGIISSTTIMANMPGFEEASNLIHENKLFDYVGIHLNLTEGIPLTDKIRRISRCCNEEGRFCLSRDKSLFILKDDEKRAVFEELEAQVLRCRRQGIPLTHADSHQHIHTEWAIVQIVKKLVKIHKIPYVRLSRNIGADIPLSKKLYKWFYNNKLRISGLSRTQYFGSYNDLIYFNQKRKKSNFSCEILVHPVLNCSKEVVIGNDNSILSFGNLFEKFDPVSAVSFVGKKNINFKKFA